VYHIKKSVKNKLGYKIWDILNLGVCKPFKAWQHSKGVTYCNPPNTVLDCLIIGFL